MKKDKCITGEDHACVEESDGRRCLACKKMFPFGFNSMKNTKEINRLKRELVSRGDMKSIIKKLSEQDDQIRWLIAQIEFNQLPTTDTHFSYEVPDYQCPPKLTLWQKLIGQFLP